MKKYRRIVVKKKNLFNFSFFNKLKKTLLKRLKVFKVLKSFYIKHNNKILLNLFLLKQYFLLKTPESKTFLLNKDSYSLVKKTSNNIKIGNKFKNFNLFNKFLSFVFKEGKKAVWEKGFIFIFDLLSTKLKYSKSVILLKIFSRLFTRVEIKKVKIRKRITLLPVFIKLHRSLFLALKWIFLASKKKKSIFSFKNLLFTELLQILIQKSSIALQKFVENNTLAYKNRSHIHYRWQKTR